MAACRKENVDGREAALNMAKLNAALLMSKFLPWSVHINLIEPQLDFMTMIIWLRIVDIGATMTTLSVLSSRTIYTREQIFGGHQLTEEIMQRYGLSLEEAVLAKKTGELPDDYEPEILGTFYGCGSATGVSWFAIFLLVQQLQ